MVQDPTPAPAVVQTPPARKPWTPKQKDEEEEEPEEPTPVVQPPEEVEPEEVEVEKPRPKPPTYTPQPQPKQEARPRDPVRVPAAAEPAPEEVVVVEQRGLFRIKDEPPNLGMAYYSSPLLFPTLKEEKSRGSKSRSGGDEDPDDGPPISEGMPTRPPSQPRRKRFNLAEEFREAIALAWERALVEVEKAWAVGPTETTALERIAKLINKDDDEEAESFAETNVGDSQSRELHTSEEAAEEDKESLEQFSSVFGRQISEASEEESSSLAEGVKRVQRMRYARRLERRTGNTALQRRTQHCWTQRVEVCRRLLLSVDRLKAKASC